MKAWLVKHGRGWLPADREAETLHARMGTGEAAEFRIVRPRSVQWNRLYFALCRLIGENQHPQREEDSIDAELRVLAGHFDVLHIKARQDAAPVEVRVPRRIAFHKLTADEWQALWPSIEQAVIDKFGDTYLRQINIV